LVIYRPDGSVQQRLQYVDGLLDGEAVDLDAAATVRRRSVYRAGRLDGDVVEYDEAGHAAFRTRFVADRQVGERVAAADASAGRAPWYRRLLG
jgi:antitoxin component YwqK of YwqJK toxin-antitoxin module